MIDQHYTDTLAKALSSPELKKRLVWNKGLIIPFYRYDPSIIRWDAYYNIIMYDEYGNRNSPYGWEYDHYPLPKCMGGSDEIYNLRPLHFKVNASRGGFLSALLQD